MCDKRKKKVDGGNMRKENMHDYERIHVFSITYHRSNASFVSTAPKAVTPSSDPTSTIRPAPLSTVSDGDISSAPVALPFLHLDLPIITLLWEVIILLPKIYLIACAAVTEL